MWQYSGIVAAMGVSALVAGALTAGIVRTQRGAAARWFAVAMLACVVFSVASMLEAAVVPVWAKILASKAAYPGLTAVGPAFFMFSLLHGQPERRVSRQQMVALWLPAALGCLLVASNEWHHWAWPSVTAVPGPQGAAALYAHGPVVYLIAFYEYALMVAGGWLLLRTVHHSPDLYRRQARPVTSAVALGLLANAAYLAGWSPWPGVDLLPVVFSACGALMAWSVFGLGMFDLVPLARGLAVDHLTDAVLTFSPKHVLVDANPAARSLVGEGAVIGAEVNQVLARWPVVRAVVKQGFEGRFEQSVGEGGTTSWLDVAVSVVRGDGQALGTIVVARDVSDSRRAEAHRGQLQQRLYAVHHEESLGRMAGGVAHHFNNQLGIVLGHLELARMGLDEAADQGVLGHLRSAHQAAERMAQLSSEMLAYCGGLFGRRERVASAGLVTAAAQLWATALPKHVTLALDLPDDLPPIRVEPAELRTALGHLVDNAVEALGERAGRITLSGRPVNLSDPLPADLVNAEALTPGSYVELAVTDDGPGMDGDVLQHAFEPFFSTHFAGRGLGLARVLGFVRSHRGAARLTSAVDRGTSAVIWLPVAEPD